MKNLQILNSFHLKMIALVTMLIDHLGDIFFPECELLRIIGRMSFILFAFLLVEGTKHTKHFDNYLKKLFIWAIISEIPFDLAINGEAFHWEYQNVFWTLFLSALGIYFLQKNPAHYYKILVPGIVLMTTIILRSDYDFLGVIIIYTFYFSKNILWKISFISMANILLGFISKIQFFGILGMIPILFYNGKRGKKTVNIFYSFYALHLLIFAIIKIVIAK